MTWTWKSEWPSLLLLALMLALLPIVGAVIYLVFRFLPAIDPRKSNYEAFRTAYDVIRHGTLALITVLYGLTIAILRGVAVDMALAGWLRTTASIVGVLSILVGGMAIAARVSHIAWRDDPARTW